MGVSKRAGVAALVLMGCTALGGEPLLKNPSFETPKEQRNWFSDQPAHWVAVEIFQALVLDMGKHLHP